VKSKIEGDNLHLKRAVPCNSYAAFLFVIESQALVMTGLI